MGIIDADPNDPAHKAHTKLVSIAGKTLLARASSITMDYDVPTRLSLQANIIGVMASVLIHLVKEALGDEAAADVRGVIMSHVESGKRAGN